MKTNPTEPKKELSPEEKRVRIAEACGWTINRVARLITRNKITVQFHRGETAEDYLPDYLGDLNAMHEAEKVICHPMPGDLNGDLNARATAFGDILSEICWRDRIDGKHWGLREHATAAQRADAFLAAIANKRPIGL
jgi:hypothetical protein